MMIRSKLKLNNLRWGATICVMFTAIGLAAGCSNGDGRFAAETNDEYTEPLTNAVIGTPTGLLKVGADGGVTSVPTSGTSAAASATSGAASSGTAAGSAGKGTAGSSKGGTGGTITVDAGTGFPGSSGTVGMGASGSTAASGRAASGASGSSATGSVGGGASGSEVTGSVAVGPSGSVAASGSVSSPEDASVPIEFGDAGFAEAGPDDAGSPGGFGFWHFDDCSPTSNFLIDSSGFGANAQHALGASCQPGISGEGVQIRTAKDIIQVPDEPQFTVSSRVAVAAWVHPNVTTGDQPIVIKRLNSSTSFSLGIHNGNIEMSVVLETGTTVISRAPISAGKWTHVAGLYDGTFVFLLINGQQFGQVYGGENLRNVFAPIRIGATTQSQHFSGIIDEVFVSTRPVTTAELAALACISRPSTFTMTPAVGGPVPVGTPVQYDVKVTDNDIGACSARFYDLFFQSVDPTVSLSQSFFFQSATPGMTFDVPIDATASDSADPGPHTIHGSLSDFSPTAFESLSASVDFEVSQPTGCFVATRRELMITDTSVVDDPVRTAGSSNGNAPVSDGGIIVGTADGGTIIPIGGGKVGVAAPAPVPVPAPAPVGVPAPAPVPAPTINSVDGGPVTAGVWSFGNLMRQMAPTPEQAPAMTLQLLEHWLSDQQVNGFTVSARPLMKSQLIDIWPKTPSGELDLDQSPLTLQAIVNRVDLRDLSKGSAGEGRFVYGVNGPINFQQFTVIVEFNLVAQTPQDVLDWANAWHGLSTHPFPSEEYNAALEAITQRFAGRGAQPSGVNGSALIELRTNEIALSQNGLWELRSFVLSPTTGFFDETTVKETPDLSFNNTPTLADFANQNADAIKAVVPGAMGNTVPPKFEGQNFLAGSVFNPLIEWNAPGILDPDARFHLSQNTCNGCHGPETSTTFLMITPRQPGTEAVLSTFLTGATVGDPFSGQVRTLNDLGRRKTDLLSLVCSSDGGSPPGDASAPPPTDSGVGPVSDVIAPPPLDASAPPPAADASAGPLPPGVSASSSGTAASSPALGEVSLP